MHGCLRIHDLHEVRAVDDCIELTAVDAQVIAHIPKFQSHTWIALGIDIAGIVPRPVVVIVQRGLVAAHIALVEQEESLDLSALSASDMVALAPQDRIFLTAGGQTSGKTDGQQSDKNDIC